MQEWRERVRPVRLENRFEFPDYATLRDFLDLAAEQSAKDDFYPDMGFGKDYVNITIHLDDGEEQLTESQYEFARQLDKLAEQVIS